MAKTQLEITRRRIKALALTVLAVAGLLVAWVRHAPDFPRHPFLTGWFLFAVMLFLTFLNLRKKVPFLRMGSVGFWLQLHIYVGLFSGPLFFVHMGFSWPHGTLNQMITVCFAAVFISGLLGLWMSRAFPMRLTDEGFETPFERLPQARRLLRDEAQALVLAGADGQTSQVIAEFYTRSLGLFFAKPRNLWAHLLRSRAAQTAHRSQFDEIRRYARKAELGLLDILAGLVERKHLLDFQHAHQLALRLWLFVHIPLSYSLLILSVVHILVIHSFSGSAP